MDIQKKHKKRRTIFTADQVAALEKEFKRSKCIGYERVAELSKSLNLTEENIKIWFKNRRSKDKRSKSLSPNNNNMANPHGAVLKNLSLQESHQFFPEIEAPAMQNVFCLQGGSSTDFLNQSDNRFGIFSQPFVPPIQFDNTNVNPNNYLNNAHNSYNSNNFSNYTNRPQPEINQNQYHHPNYLMRTNENLLHQYNNNLFLHGGPGYSAIFQNHQRYPLAPNGLFRQETQTHQQMNIMNGMNNVPTTQSYLQTNGISGPCNVANNVQNYSQTGTNNSYDLCRTDLVDGMFDSTNNLTYLQIGENGLNDVSGTEGLYYMSSSQSHPQTIGMSEMCNLMVRSDGLSNVSNIQNLTQRNRSCGPSPETMNAAQFNNEPI